jgi:hypothetical protein
MQSALVVVVVAEHIQMSAEVEVQEHFLLVGLMLPILAQ